MKNKKLIIFLYFMVISAVAFAQGTGQEEQSIFEEPVLAKEARLAAIENLEPFKPGDRVLIFAPHPDDESIACAGIIQEAVRAGADVHILYLTNGDNNEFAFIVYSKHIPILPGELVRLGGVRRNESIKAMRALGLGEPNLIFLGYPDFGTLQIFKDYWQENKPYRSMLTRATSVPYKEDPSFGSQYIGTSILNDIKNTLLRYRPNKIFVSHPADLNRDHKALYLFLEVALADLAKELPRPKVYNYLVHWLNWPMPRHYHPELPLLPPGEFSAEFSKSRWLKYKLSAQNLEKKHKNILVFQSQTQSSAFYLLSFGRKNELFSTFPEINLSTFPQTLTQKTVLLKDRIAAFFTGAGIPPQPSLDNTEQPPSEETPVIYGCEDSFFRIRIYKRKDISRTLKTVVYLFGYSEKTPFAQMPKITITTKYTQFKILGGAKPVIPKGVSLELKPEELVIKVPFELLGDPDFILASVRTNTRFLSVDTLAFRKVNIRRK